MAKYKDDFYEMIKYLLEAGANPNTFEENGQNPLLLHLNNVIASDNNDFVDDIIVLLLSFGADDSINFVYVSENKAYYAVTCRDVIIGRWGKRVS